MEDTKKILAVDDDENTLYLIDNTLSAGGYDVIKADNGFTAISKATSEHPGLIILDILLPRLDGLKVIKKLKENPVTKRIPVLITSAHSKRDVIVELLKMGVTNFLAKPFDINDLMKRVNELLPISSAAAPLSNLKIKYTVSDNILNIKLTGDMTSDDEASIIENASQRIAAGNVDKIIFNILELNSLSNMEIKILESIRNTFEGKGIKVKFSAGDSKSLRANLIRNSSLHENLLSY